MSAPRRFRYHLKPVTVADHPQKASSRNFAPGRESVARSCGSISAALVRHHQRQEPEVKRPENRWAARPFPDGQRKAHGQNGAVVVQPNAGTGRHHHGELETVLYIVRGRARMRWGDRLVFCDEADPGDFIYVLPYAPASGNQRRPGYSP